MLFEPKIRELYEELEKCRDDEKALELAQELQAALHKRIEQLRAEVAGLMRKAQASSGT